MLNFLQKKRPPVPPAELITEHFESPSPLQTAVLFLVFNRPNTTEQVFDAIRRAKPPRLYVAADGPRSNCEGDAEKVRKVCEIATAVDWNCEVNTLFREKNLGCKYAVSGGITWFFEHEEQGIILEDDCLPSQSFFWFCEELLVRYRNDERVGHIGGTLPICVDTSNQSYMFTRYNRIWGWATWRRSWSNYDLELESLDEIDMREFNALFATKKEASSYKKILSMCKKGEIDTWDYQWFFSRLLQNCAIQPSVNLVSNIGFNSDATHTTTKGRLSDLKRYELKFPMYHPRFIIPNVHADLLWSEQIK